MSLTHNGNLAYLAGAIEHAPDKGIPWRRELTSFLEDELAHRVFDPTINEMALLDERERIGFRSWKKADLPRFRKTVRKIIDNDLNMLHSSTDYVICYWDQFTSMGGGTHGELTCAYRLGIPVFMVTPLTIDEISGWIVACTDEIFPDFGALKEYLKIRYRHS
ncbi:hypothetical protein JW905_19175 [bacterium]|nr:hypothetical protein [candidate division CSSED10-310 bacterium]